MLATVEVGGVGGWHGVNGPQGVGGWQCQRLAWCRWSGRRRRSAALMVGVASTVSVASAVGMEPMAGAVLVGSNVSGRRHAGADTSVGGSVVHRCNLVYTLFSTLQTRLDADVGTHTTAWSL